MASNTGKVRGKSGWRLSRPGGWEAQACGQRCVSQHALNVHSFCSQQTATAAGGTHPTGMHSCYSSIH